MNWYTAKLLADGLAADRQQQADRHRRARAAVRQVERRGPRVLRRRPPSP